MDETTKETQQNELAALRAIFMDDFKDVETRTAWNVKPEMPEFVITVRPTEDEIKDSVSVGLRVRLPKTYPRTAPQTQLVDGMGLSDVQIEDAQKMIKGQIAGLVGGEMIYELAVSLSDFITVNNSAAVAARPSFYQQMVDRERAGRRADMEREEAFRKQEQALYAEEQEDLQRRIYEELERKHQQLLSDQQKQQHLSDIADAVHSVAGRWAEGIQLLQFDNAIYLNPQQQQQQQQQQLNQQTHDQQTDHARSGPLGTSRDGCFTTVALEDSTIVDPLCAVYDAYPTDLIGASIHLSDRFTVQCFSITTLHYLTDNGRRQLEKVRSRISDLAQIRHPNLVAVYGCHLEMLEEQSQHPGIRLWVLSDPLSSHDGSTLEDVLESCGSIATAQTRRYLRHILLALVNLHAAGFIHRGVALSNILLTKEGRGRFTARLFNTSYREELISLHRLTPLSGSIGDSVGNDIRVAPEVLDRPDMLGRKNDIWCTGVAGLLMALGMDALKGVPIGQEPRVLYANRDAMDPDLFAVLEMMLVTDHRQRPSAMEALNDPFFNQGLDGEPSVHNQALDSASRGLNFELQRSAARLADKTTAAETLAVVPASSSVNGHHQQPFFSVAQRNIAPSKDIKQPIARHFAPGSAADSRRATNTTAGAAAGISRRGPRRINTPLSSTEERFIRPSSSRYRADFEEIEFLGKGGFGSVVKARNRIDGRYYAIKKIKLDARDTESNKKIFREVTTLSRLHHQNVVRYYTTWVEDMEERFAGIPEEDSELSSARGLVSTDDDESFASNAFALGGAANTTSMSPWSSDDHDDAEGEFSETESDSSSDSSDSSGSGDSNIGDSDSEEVNVTAGDYNTVSDDEVSSRIDAMTPRSGDDDGILTAAQGGRSNKVFSAIRFGTMGDNGTDTADETPSASKGARSSHPASKDLPVRAFGTETSDSDSDSASSSLHSSSNKPQVRPRARTSSSVKKPVVGRRKNQILYIQMEYCENKTLNDLIREGIDEKEGWRIFRQVLEGLNHIHQSGVIHRDLKPVNAFLDGAGDVKIGDFGLATSSFTPMEAGTVSRHLSLDRSGEDALTADIGTSSYVAPEVTSTQGGAARYNQKVDMYSLGIIFFEMCYPLNTAMERASVLHNLRKPEIEFPVDFPVERLQLQHRIIRRLLNHTPRLRPSSTELLESDLLPPRVEDEHMRETIRTIANPSQPYFGRLMDSLFARTPDTHIDATFDYRANDVQTEQLNAVFLDRVRELMTRVFRVHAAVELSTPALTPRTALLDTYQRPALYMDARGNVVQLPYDHAVPFARYVARTRMAEIKRYCFDRYFVANAAGGQPIAHTAASFDAVTNRSAHAVAAAEVISVACEVLDELPPFRRLPTLLMINHMNILDAILAFCGVLHPEWPLAASDRKNPTLSARQSSSAEERQRHTQFVRNVCFCLGSLYKDTPQAVRQRIQAMSLTTGARLNSQTLDRLQLFMDIRGDVNSVQREVLGRIGSDCGMSGTPFAARGALYVQAAIRAFNELRFVESMVRHFGVVIPFVYSPLFNHHYAYYEGGYAFQIMTEKSSSGRSKVPQVLAVGGRYDGLLKRFRHLAGSYAWDGGVKGGVRDRKSAFSNAAGGSGKLGDKKQAGVEMSSISFAGRMGSIHSTDVWQQMNEKQLGSPTSPSFATSSAASTNPSSSLSDTWVPIGTNLSSGSAVLGTARDVVCVGVQIQLDLVIQEMARYQQQVLQAAEASSTPSFGIWTRKRCDIVVASFGTRPMLRERIALARELWACGLRTDFLFNDDPEMTMERLVDICRDQGMNWIITIKRKPSNNSGGSGYSSSTESRRIVSSSRKNNPPVLSNALVGEPRLEKYMYKVKNILRRVECEVPREQLCEWLHMDINEQFRVDLKIHESKGGAGSSAGIGGSGLAGAGVSGSNAESSGGVMRRPLVGPAMGSTRDLNASGIIIGSGNNSGGNGSVVGGGQHPFVGMMNGHVVSQSFAGTSGSALLGIGPASSGSGIGAHFVPLSGTSGNNHSSYNPNLHGTNNNNNAGGSNASGTAGSGSVGSGGRDGGSGNARLELVLVNPQQTSTKNINRSKHKLKMALTDRAMTSVSRIMGEVKSAPVLVLDLGPELVRRLAGEASILTDAGYKRVMELCSAHQRAYVVELRSVMERYRREGCSYVWLYSVKANSAVTYQL
ncbi:eukaryotic translation initiation factor 2-alpha kinase [Coemansia sp. RSA 1722]|nr:eukaryotic translation initiation factor 2-alpha kinase [Coemansia sp. RSA 1722]